MKNKFLTSCALVGVAVSAFSFLPTKNIKTYASFETNNCKAYCLMEKNSGTVLQANNEHQKLPIASVTKLMTILITLENVENGEISLDDSVKVSENAEGMGGSQIFLDANENYVLKDLLKSVIVASANDSSVALAEHIAGSESNFVRIMNNRACELSMADTHYDNCTGLPSPDGYSSAYDQAILLSKVLNYPTYHELRSVWNEDFVHPSGRTTQMTNTNKLSRFYEGCLGGKTGSTSEAKYCLAVGARRNNMENIAVVLGADTTKNRFKIASDLLDYGFDNFESKTLFSNLDLADKFVEIKGQNRRATLRAERDFTLVVDKNTQPNFELNFCLPERLTKVVAGEVVGNVEIVVDGIIVDVIDLISNETYNEASVWDYFKEII